MAEKLTTHDPAAALVSDEEAAAIMAMPAPPAMQRSPLQRYE